MRQRQESLICKHLQQDILSEERKELGKSYVRIFEGPFTTIRWASCGLARSVTHQRMLHMILNGKIECSLAIPKGSQQKQSIIIEENPPDSDPIASFIDDLKSNEEASKATKRRPVNTAEPDEGFPHASRFLETVNDLAKSLQKTNDTLNLERENSRKFMEENFQLQIRLRDLEIFQARKQVSPTLKRHDTFLIDSLENNTSEVNTMKQVGETHASNNSVNRSGKSEIPRTADASNANESYTATHGNRTAKQHKNKEGKSKKNTQNQQQPRGKENNRNGTSKFSKMVSNETSRHPIRICMVGDSQLRRMDADKMSNNHHEVMLNEKSGMKVEEAANHVDCEADVIIMHAGTNNLRDSTPEDRGGLASRATGLGPEGPPSAKVPMGPFCAGRKILQMVNFG